MLYSLVDFCTLVTIAKEWDFSSRYGKEACRVCENVGKVSKIKATFWCTLGNFIILFDIKTPLYLWLLNCYRVLVCERQCVCVIHLLNISWVFLLCIIQNFIFLTVWKWSQIQITLYLRKGLESMRSVRIWINFFYIELDLNTWPFRHYCK